MHRHKAGRRPFASYSPRHTRGFSQDLHRPLPTDGPPLATTPLAHGLRRRAFCPRPTGKTTEQAGGRTTSHPRKTLRGEGAPEKIYCSSPKPCGGFAMESPARKGTVPPDDGFGGPSADKMSVSVAPLFSCIFPFANARIFRASADASTRSPFLRHLLRGWGARQDMTPRNDPRSLFCPLFALTRFPFVCYYTAK